MPEARPPVWVGHISLRTRSMDDSAAFMERIGMRGVFRGDEVVIFELRGGTHLVVINDADSTPGEAGFDLMVEDIDAAHADYAEAGEVSEIERGNIHDAFVVTEPGGNTIVVNSSHVTDLPI